MTDATRSTHEQQLELFHVSQPSAPRPRREALGRWWFQLRYDQLVLSGVAGLIGLTVVFACGVERGKQLVRSERFLLPRQGAASPVESAAKPSSTQTGTAAGAVKPARQPVVPGVAPKVTAPVKSAARRARYAIQVVTFSRPLLAKKEMERLQSTGERAFLVMRDGRTVVCVGPFPSKVNASEKLSTLKSRYRDCFIRVL